MATGFDKLIDFLLSEIALCGTEGTYRVLLPITGCSSRPSIAPKKLVPSRNYLSRAKLLNLRRR
jgi:hypothetical protein